MKGNLPMSVRKIITAKMAKDYRKASKRGKGKILDSLEELTGFNRSYLARRLRSFSSHQGGRVRKRRCKYSKEDERALLWVWRLMNFACGKRLKAVMAEVIDNLERNGHWGYGEEVKRHLLEMSSSTIDRRLRRYRLDMKRRRRATTKPGTLLKSRIPVLWFHEWWEERPGFVEMDLVAHCGASPSGEYINTLNTVDVKTGWVVLEAVMGKSRRYTLEAFDRGVRRFPFRVLGIHSDNGSEFINDHFYNWCLNNGVNFSKGRPYKKNDNPRVEGKNYTVVRRAVGYWRYDMGRELELMRELYLKLEDYHNYFQPTSKVTRKERLGDGRVRKVYDMPRTPYQRVLESEYVGDEEKKGLRERHRELDLYQLKSEIDRLISKLYRSVKRKGV